MYSKFKAFILQLRFSEQYSLRQCKYPYCCKIEGIYPYCCKIEGIYPYCCKIEGIYPYCCKIEGIYPYCCKIEGIYPYCCKIEGIYPYSCKMEGIYPYCCKIGSIYPYQGSTLTVVRLPGASENGTQLVRSGKRKWFCDMFNSWKAKWLILNYSVLEVAANFT